MNCAAPIAKGLHAGGTRVETALAAMIALPTLNVIVLTMLFSLFPLYLAVFKVALSVFVILVLVPLICTFLPQNSLHLNEPEAAVCTVPTRPDATASDTGSVVSGLVGFARDFARNLWFVVSVTVPLMVLAGLFGAIVATLLPPELLVGQPFGWGMLILVAVVGLFAPVPIGFDVVLAAVLLNSGLDIAYVMALLFSLGIFSVYSFFIVSHSSQLTACIGLLSKIVQYKTSCV